MGWHGFVKGVVVLAVLLGAVVGLWYGVVILFFSGSWWSPTGVLLAALGAPVGVGGPGTSVPRVVTFAPRGWRGLAIG